MQVRHDGKKSASAVTERIHEMQIEKREDTVRVPEWLLVEEDYVPSKDRDRFLAKTTLSILSVLAKMKNKKEYGIQNRTAPALRIAGAVFVLILLSLSKNPLFPVTMLVAILLRLSLLKGKQIRAILGNTAVAVCISGLILLPAAILGNAHTFFYITEKIAVGVTLLGVLSETMPWNQITSGLKLFHLPDLFIFTMDITLKYILLLGEICFQMMQALKIRCIGRNPAKSKAMSGILGVTFLKSKELSEEMYQAMECRGFDGTYVIWKRKTSAGWNLLHLTGIILVFLFFLKMEGYL